VGEGKLEDRKKGGVKRTGRNRGGVNENPSKGRDRQGRDEGKAPNAAKEINSLGFDQTTKRGGGKKEYPDNKEGDLGFQKKKLGGPRGLNPSQQTTGGHLAKGEEKMG